MFNDLINKVKDKVNDIKQVNEEYQRQLQNANIIQNLTPINIQTNYNKKISYIPIYNLCPDINETKCKLIVDLLPINELYLTVLYSKEIRTNEEYYIVPTNTCIWFINQKGYIRYNYESLTMSIIKSALMSKVVNISNFILDITGNKVEYLMNLINDQNFRIQEITNKNNTLFGITPTLRIINEIESGISTDNNKNIVFHSKELNRAYNIKDLDNYELLIDNNPTIQKKTKSNIRITSGKSSCYEMKLKITPKDGQVFLIPILNRSTFEKMYQASSEEYHNSFKMAREIIDILDNLNDEYLSGY